jgi:hypothetical protein
VQVTADGFGVVPVPVKPYVVVAFAPSAPL